MIEIDDVESVIESRLQQFPDNASLASSLRSEALVPTTLDSTNTLNVRIVDFGVGEWPVNTHISNGRT